MIEQHKALAALTTLGVSANARYFAAVNNVQELQFALDFAKQETIPWCVLGGGSNVLFAEDYPGLVIHLAMQGVSLLEETGEQVLVNAKAGENWHEFVKRCLLEGWYGLENLALIPGSVGAAPVQNIGAYGVEIEQFIESVEVFMPETGKSVAIPRQACQFAYRSSRFRQPANRDQIIVSVTFRLHRIARTVITYASLADYLAAQVEPEQRSNPAAVFAAVCAIRQARLPEPSVLGNAGSFFKNPVVNTQVRDRLLQEYPHMPWYPEQDPAQSKLSAAWLIEQTGWKGKRLGQAGVYAGQALVLVNHGQASGQEMLALARRIRAEVSDKFGIGLQTEVRILPATLSLD
ncbi:MAG: UDP-N-acetylmuramate dehydrogenase [Pseudomonadales bacterium]|nr:UDP-N-acetylmuramate dehydrogenase [Pseudomonadales bacterium]